VSSAVEKILAEINSLTPAEQRELQEHLERAQRSEIGRKAQLVQEIKGKYAFVPISSDAFVNNKRAEIALEERRFEKT
jgi:hypothetical protein